VTSDDDPLLRFRERFPITQRTNYLISNSLGAMPHAARAAVGQFLDMWDTRGVRAWAEGWWVLQEQVGAVLARDWRWPIDHLDASEHRRRAGDDPVVL
jgi:kynureninase